jgi:hypothetical protein
LAEFREILSRNAQKSANKRNQNRTKNDKKGRKGEKKGRKPGGFSPSVPTLKLRRAAL